MADLKWDEYRLDKWRCVDSSGKIVERIEKSTYTGEYEVGIACYVTLQQAKAAVEATAGVQKNEGMRHE